MAIARRLQAQREQRERDLPVAQQPADDVAEVVREELGPGMRVASSS